MDAPGPDRCAQPVPGFSHRCNYLLVGAVEPAAVPVMQENRPPLFLVGGIISNLGYVCPNALGIEQLRRGGCDLQRRFAADLVASKNGAAWSDRSLL